MQRSIRIRSGPKMPDNEQLDIFYNNARKALGAIPEYHEVRSIGIDRESTGQILQFIQLEEKVGTFSLPWISDAEDYSETLPGTHIILTGYDGIPKALVRITEIIKVKFGSISYEDTKIDGPPVRELKIWKPLHTKYWNKLLSNYGKECSDEMPVIVEHFKLVYHEIN